MIPRKIYKKFVELMPIVTLDVIITNKEGEYLLVKRKNEPLKNSWWVPGGRLYKSESFKKGIIRKMREEIGVVPEKIEFVDICSTEFKNSPYGCRIHNVGLFFKGKIGGQTIRLDKQSSDWKWSKTLPKLFLSILNKSLIRGGVKK